MKIASIVGARPQFVKLAPLSKELSGKHEELIIHTGQHYDYALSEQIFSDLNLRNPDFHLGAGSGSHAVQTGEMMISIEKVLLKIRPDIVIVFGDANSTLASSLVAAKLNIPLIHVEAGLRSYNRILPEEINRVVTDHLSDYLFAPTPLASETLHKEGLGDKTHLTGDLMVDSLTNSISLALDKFSSPGGLDIVNLEYNLLTLHRNYNVDSPHVISKLLSQLENLNEMIIFPVHPRTRKILKMIDFSSKNIFLTDPLGYLDFIAAQYYSKRVLTDSGGVQKEAYILKRPCITLRTETEWSETVEAGWNLLINPADDNMSSKIKAFIPPNDQANLFGYHVAEKMTAILDSI